MGWEMKEMDWAREKEGEVMCMFDLRFPLPFIRIKSTPCLNIIVFVVAVVAVG